MAEPIGRHLLKAQTFSGVDSEHDWGAMQGEEWIWN